MNVFSAHVASRFSSVSKWMVIASGAALVSVSVSASTVTLETSNGYGATSFATATGWSDGQAPSAANDYWVTGRTLRTAPSVNPQVFAGNSLSLVRQGTAWGTLSYKGTSDNAEITIADLRLNGGEVANASDNFSDFILNGAVTLEEQGGRFTLTNWNRLMEVNAAIRGSGMLEIRATGDTNPAGKGTVILNGSNSYSGGTLVLENSLLIVNSASALGSGDLTVNQGGNVILTSSGAFDPSAMLRLATGVGDRSVRLDFSGSMAISGIVVNGVEYTQVGTYGGLDSGAMYTFAELEGAGVLQVIPESNTVASVLTLLLVVGAVCLNRRR